MPLKHREQNREFAFYHILDLCKSFSTMWNVRFFLQVLQYSVKQLASVAVQQKSKYVKAKFRFWKKLTSDWSN